ncbi:MAG TPA: hypothetical protein VNX65_02255 [Patescibacteria group bacterium]|jgi:hypothetical protein|nr:hypothetical protein [Patescibacteria group bacterium]
MVIDVVDIELFKLLRHEAKVGHSLHYSASLHELEPEHVKEVLEAPDYDTFCNLFEPLDDESHEITSDWQ